MENGISDSLDRTLELLKGEVQRVGVAAALAEISGWEGRIAASGDPELESVADTLAELRVQLEGNAFDPVTVGALMLSLGGQVERVAGSGVGASVAGRLSNLAALLGERGDSISNKGMQH
ncbi:MAG: hypothetical protein ACRDTR_00870 [Rubrobacter sp.]